MSKYGPRLLDHHSRRAILPVGENNGNTTNGNGSAQGVYMDLLVDTKTTENGADAATFTAAILISLITTIYSNCKPVPGLVVLGELRLDGTPISMNLSLNEKLFGPLLSTHGHGMRKLLVPVSLRDQLVPAVRMEQEKRGGGQGEQVVVVGYKNLRELLTESLMVANADNDSSPGNNGHSREAEVAN